MVRKLLRASSPLALLLCLLAWRSAGCGKTRAPEPAPANPRIRLMTPLMTPPPPRPTVTMWKGVTRVPELPE